MTKHGLHKAPEYKTWAAMKSRCDRPTEQHYKDYGARGITYAPEWASFEQFFADMGPRPSSKHTIDRKDNNGNYCKANCRWATQLEQHNNKRSNVVLTVKGRSQTVAQWARELGYEDSIILNRLKRGWSIERALFTNPKDYRNR